MKRTAFALALLMASVESLSAAYAPGPLPPQPAGTTNADVGATEAFELRGNGTISGTAAANFTTAPAQLYGGMANLTVTFDGLTEAGAQVQVQTAGQNGVFYSNIMFLGLNGKPTLQQTVTANGKFNFLASGDTQFRILVTQPGTGGTISYTWVASQATSRVVAALTASVGQGVADGNTLRVVHASDDPLLAKPGVGADTLVPGGTAAGVALGTMPTAARGARLYLNPGDGVTYGIAPTCGNTPTIKHVASQPGAATSFTNIDENLNGQMICVLAITGTPSYRWY